LTSVILIIIYNIWENFKKISDFFGGFQLLFLSTILLTIIMKRSNRINRELQNGLNKKRDRRIASSGIPKKKKAKGTIHDSNDMFRDLAEKSLAGIYLIQDGIFKYVNPRFNDIFGYEADEIPDKMRPEQLVLSEDWPTVNENLRRRIAGKALSFHYEFKGIKKNKEPIILEAYGSRLLYQGKPAVMGTLLDISKRKMAEEKYRSIFENSVEGIFQSTPQGQFIVTNPAFAKMLGYNSAEELTATLTDIRHQLYVDPLRRLEFMRLLENDGLALGFECEFFKKDNGKIWIYVNARAVRDIDGTILYYEGTVEDITEGKKVKDDLSRLNKFNAAIIDNAPVAIFTLDRNGVFTSANHALAIISDLGPKVEQKLIGFNWLENPYTIRCGLAKHIESGLQGEPFQLWDFPYITYRGDRNLYMDFNGVPIKGKDGKIEGLLCIIEETTDRVKIRAKLMQEARLSAIGRLAAGIAHELNNPLATLVAHSELAGHCLKSLKGFKKKQTVLEDLKAYLEIIEAQAFRCKNVTSDILSLPWKEGFEIRDIDINKLLNTILDFSYIDQSKGKIRKEFSSSLPPVKGDIGALRQIFVNLINNAADAIEGRMDATIWIITKESDAGIQVEIKDNGIGIPDSILEKIFEPFFTTKESKRGIGLGLWLCYEFISHMGGSIKAESKPGRGTTFFVTLPMDSTQKGGTKIADDSCNDR
jgi:PAS domain S-box-containing protein